MSATMNLTSAGVQSPRSNLQSQILQRKASLTDIEKAFLSALLIDNSKESQEFGDNDHAIKQASRVLDDDMLFSVPRAIAKDDTLDQQESEGSKKLPTHKKQPSNYRFLVGLWQAHEDGVPPSALSRLAPKINGDGVSVLNGDGPNTALPPKSEFPAPEGAPQSPALKTALSYNETDDGESSVETDARVNCARESSSDASWDEEEVKHFDAWELLKDEYAGDFGFDYSPGGTTSANESELEPNTFKILGTSADDKRAHPHVLSPPLMDAIFNFVPDHLQGQNIWLKYSLVRDGASLETFKQYARASKDTLLAIETTKGDVFGVFTSHPWRTGPSFYGGRPSFVFKMRHNRNTRCYSLIEQAQLEGEVDIYFLLDDFQRPQVCTHEILGVGEGNYGKIDPTKVLRPNGDQDDTFFGENYGFAIALEDDLLSGTSSKCSSYKNPCLVNPDSHGEPFEVLNLELWTFTPCLTLDAAERLEMTQFFVSESVRSTSSYSERSFSSRDFDQTKFYRQIGQHDEHEELREQWQYRNMMDGASSKQRGIGGSPHFNDA